MSRRTGRPSLTPARPTASRSRVVDFAVAMAAAAVVAGFIGAGIGYAVARPDPFQAAVADLQAAEAKRDEAQIRELTDTARTTAGELNRVLAELEPALPRDRATPAKPATAVQLDQWQQTLRRAVQRHADTPSGATGTNIARGGLRTAVDALALAIDTYAASQRVPADHRQTLLDLAHRQRQTAVAMWSVAATQLDQLNIDAGHGHQHVYLTGHPDDGAIPADPIPEGSN